MNEENKKTGTDNKIVSFQIIEEETQDPQQDLYVRESLIREADELEEELNKRPDLADVKAPEGMYQSIVKELKARGVWEEGEVPGAVGIGEEEVSDSVAGENKGSSASVGEEKDVAKSDSEAEAISAAKSAENAQADEAALEKLYAQLPEEDRKALALGRELSRKKEAKARKRRRRRKIFKIAGVAAACLAIVFGVSMTSDANRRLVQRMWDGLMMEFGFKVNTDYTDDVESVRSKSKEEIDAMEKIGEQLGSPSIDFAYLPKGMKFEGYEITDEVLATLFYSYRDTLFYVTITSLDEEGSYYYKYDNEAIFQETVNNFDGIEAKIWEVNQDIGEETYIAEIEYGGWRYVLNGMIPLREMEKIAKFILIL